MVALVLVVTAGCSLGCTLWLCVSGVKGLSADLVKVRRDRY